MSTTQPNEASAAGAEKETRLIEKVALYAFLLNLGLAVMKVILAFHSGSLAVTAGAIDSGTDAVASLLLLGGLKLSTKKTPSFPLGLYKIENVISVFVALSIFFAGYEITREVLTRESGRPEISALVVALLFVGVLAIFLFGRYALAVGRRTGSPALIAEAGTGRWMFSPPSWCWFRFFRAILDGIPPSSVFPSIKLQPPWWWFLLPVQDGNSFPTACEFCWTRPWTLTPSLWSERSWSTTPWWLK